MARLRSSDSESATVTRLFVPLKESAPPNLPFEVHAAFVIVPAFEWPESSRNDEPEPASKPYEATAPGACVGQAAVVVVAVARDELFPAASCAVTPRV